MSWEEVLVDVEQIGTRDELDIGQWVAGLVAAVGDAARLRRMDAAQLRPVRRLGFLHQRSISLVQAPTRAEGGGVQGAETGRIGLGTPGFTGWLHGGNHLDSAPANPSNLQSWAFHNFSRSPS
jgi:hypothetical protein